MKWLVILTALSAAPFAWRWLRGSVKKSKNPFALRIFRSHSTWLRMGSLIGGRIIKFYAYLSIYKIASNGGLEALAYVCYCHMLQEGEKEHNRLKGVKNGPQSRVPKK